MEITAAGLLEVWDLFIDYVPSGKRNDTAVKFVKTLVDQDIDIEDLEELRGEDDHLDHALDSFSNSGDSDDDGYEDYEE